MTSQPEVPRSRPKSFKVALISAIASPLACALFGLLLLALAPEGPDGLTAALAAFTAFTLAIPLGIFLLLIVAASAAIASAVRKRGEEHDGSAADQNAGLIERTGYVGVVILAALPLLAGLLLLLDIFGTAVVSHATEPNQNEAEVKQAMTSSLDELDYNTLPGYRKNAEEIKVEGSSERYGPTTYSADVSLIYKSARALTVARQRLTARGWTCLSAPVATIARSAAQAATGSDSPNISCSKAGHEALTLTYVSPTWVLLQARTGSGAQTPEVLSDYKWCDSYGDDQVGELRSKCQRILGQDAAYEASKYGLSKECYAEVNSFDQSEDTKLLARCYKEYAEAQERYREAQSDSGAR